jgi:hypothetical protein
MWTSSLAGTSDARYTLQFGQTRFVVQPALGGRIVEFSIAGANVLRGLEDLGSWTNGGSTFWTSPQQAWGWPPDEALDRGAYEAILDPERHRLTLISQRFKVAHSELTVSKLFAPNVARGAVEIEYEIRNHGEPLEVAGWEISRVAAVGVTFFAGEGTSSLGDLPMPAIERDADGIVWMRHAQQPDEAKLGADATRGFVAYASPSQLFLKTFRDAPPGSTCKDEAEIELYVKPKRYVEVEQQSVCQRLEAGDTLVYRLSWFLRELPSDVKAEAMNPRLLEFAREVGDLGG